jgi:branched-chain amino acid transport system permease protein
VPSFQEHLIDKASQEPFFSRIVAAALAAGSSAVLLGLWSLAEFIPTLPPGVLLETMSRSSRFFIVGLGFMLIFVTAKVFAMSQAAIIAAGPYLTLLFRTNLAVSLPVSAALAALCCGAMGLITDAVVFRPLRAGRGTPLVGLVASLGLYTALQNMISLAFGDAAIRLTSSDLRVLQWRGVRASIIHLLPIAGGVAVLLLGYVLYRLGPVGQRIRAVAEDSELAEVKGVATARVIASSFFAGSVLMSLGGILLSLDADLTPTMGLPLLLMGIVAALLFGQLNPLSVAAGAIALGSLLTAGDTLVGSEWRNTIAFGLLVLICVRRARWSLQVNRGT